MNIGFIAKIVQTHFISWKEYFYFGYNRNYMKSIEYDWKNFE